MHTPQFQENLVVWKLVTQAMVFRSLINVSGELSSMEIGMKKTCCETEGESVSGELSSMEIQEYGTRPHIIVPRFRRT